MATQVVENLNLRLVKSERQALAARPTDDVEAYQAYLRALSYANGQDYERAAPLLQEAVARDAQFLMAYYWLCRVFVLLKQAYPPAWQTEFDRKATDALGLLEKLAPISLEAQLARGLYLLDASNEYEDALHQFETAAGRSGTNPELLDAQSAALASLGRFEESVAALKEAYLLDPQNAYVLHTLAFLLVRLRRFQEAKRYYELAIDADPSNAMVYCNAARNLIVWKGDVDAARTIWDKAPSGFIARYMCTAGSVDMYQRRYDEMLRWYDDVDLDRLPPDIHLGSLQNLGLLYRYKGDRDAEREVWQTAISLANDWLEHPPDLKTVSLSGEVGARLALAFGLAGVGRKDEALEEALRIRSLLRKDRILEATRRIGVAIVLVMSDHHEEAIDVIEEDMDAEAGFLTIPYLDMPHWDPLRTNPRFQAIVKASPRDSVALKPPSSSNHPTF